MAQFCALLDAKHGMHVILAGCQLYGQHNGFAAAAPRVLLCPHPPTFELVHKKLPKRGDMNPFRLSSLVTTDLIYLACQGMWTCTLMR